LSSGIDVDIGGGESVDSGTLVSYSSKDFRGTDSVGEGLNVEFKNTIVEGISDPEEGTFRVDYGSERNVEVRSRGTRSYAHKVGLTDYEVSGGVTVGIV